MLPFKKIAGGLDVNSAQAEIEENKSLFGEFPMRGEFEGSPHKEMLDIWLRYGDLTPCFESGDFSTIADEHDSIWLKNLPALKRICFDVMTLVDGERLGGVLITKLPPKGKIYPHIDSGWHAKYYDKFYVPLKVGKGSVFSFDGGDIRSKPGDVWQFNNAVRHWINNDSKVERISMIICIKQSKFSVGA